MIGIGWLTLKQAHEALRAGRLDEAHTCLVQPQVQGHRRCLELLHRLMHAYVERADKHLRNHDTTKAWVDLLKAEQIGISDNAPFRLRQTLTRLGLAEVHGLLDAGQPRRALDAIHALHEKAVQQPELDGLEQGTKEWVAAIEAMDRGEFARALQSLERATAYLSAHARALNQATQLLAQRQREFLPLVHQLHEVAQAERWAEVLHLSEKVLAMAPQYAEVRRLRSRAWKALEPPTLMVARPAPLLVTPAPVKELPGRKRLILWIDGVGGYLLLLENSVTLGQGGPDAAADIPLIADVSRLHTRLTRDSEGYLIEAIRPVRVNNQDTDRTLLRSGDRLTLGSSCQLLFRQDVPVSASARLDVASGHRFSQAVDGVLLMAETLVLGPTAQSHVLIPDLRESVILYRNRDEISIRATEDVTINGRPIQGRGVLEPGCTVTGSAFGLSLELVDSNKSVRGYH